MFWIIFGFNGKLADGNGALPVLSFREEGGTIHLCIILGIAIVILVLFMIYAFKDNSEIKIYNNGYEVDHYKNNNLFSPGRIAQYAFLVLLIIELITVVVRVMTLNMWLTYTSIFERDIMILGFEFMAVYYLIFIGSLFYEYIDKRK